MDGFRTRNWRGLQGTGGDLGARPRSHSLHWPAASSVVDGVAGSGPATASCINIKTLAGDMQMLRSQHHPYLSPSLLVPAVARLSVILARSFSSALSLLRSPTAVHAPPRHPVPQLARQPAPPLDFHCHSLSAPRHACVIGRIWRPN
jgi:hypothetical protein